VRFYAELRDFLAPAPLGRIDRDFREPGSVKDVIESYGVPHTEVEVILANGQSVDFGYQVVDGDRISVYPVFESFDVSPLVRVRPQPLREVRFVLDVHLGRLARRLRLLGFDCHYRLDASDDDLVAISTTERRILLTRDLGLLKRKAITHGTFVRATDPREQVREMVRRFQLAERIAPFTRCLACNGPLEAVAKADVEQRLPPMTAAYDEFSAAAATRPIGGCSPRRTDGRQAIEQAPDCWRGPDPAGNGIPMSCRPSLSTDEPELRRPRRVPRDDVVLPGRAPK
jgi:uncharacterized protein with PIN domain